MTREKLRDVVRAQTVAILIVAAMLGVRWLLAEWVDYEAPLLLFMLAVVGAAYYGGLWPGLTAMVLSVLAGNFFSVAPVGEFSLTSPVEHVRAAIFVFVGMAVSGLCEALHRARRRVERKNAQLALEIRERQQAEATRRDSEERLQFALDAANMVHWDWNLADGTSEPTIPARRLLGDAAGAAQSLLELVHPADWDRVQTAVELARKGESPYDLEYRLATASGEIRWVVDRARFRNEPQTGQQHLTGVCIDITDRKRAVLALRDSEARFRLLADSMPQIVYVLDREGKASYVNRQWQEYTGLETMNAELLALVAHPDDVEGLENSWRTAFAMEAPFSASFRWRRASDGAYRWFLTRAIPQYDEGGEIAQWFGTSTDIDDQKRAEQAAREGERRYRAIGEAIDYGVWIYEPRSQNLYLSQSLLDLLGITRDECQGNDWTKYLHPDDAERTRAAWAECLARGSTWDVEHRFRGRDGQWHPILGRGVPVRDETGEITSWVGINLDISRLKQAEEKLREADRRKDEFLAMLAHELRNPLAPIRNAVQLLNLSPTADPLIETAREMIGRQIEQLVRLVDDLLDVSRITSGKLQLRKMPTALADIMRIAIETSQPLIEADQHELDVDLPREAILIDGDQARLAQVFSNLLNNAAKYSPPGSHIRLAAQRRGNQIEVSVRDDGVGIAPEVLPHVFNMFAQAERSLHRSQGGLGLGLTLVKRLAEMHGGSVEAHSAGQGQGSEFLVRLPLLVSNTRPRIPPVEPQRVERAVQRKVLVVDDNKDAAESLAMLLRALGNEVHTAHDGLAAVEAAESFQPEVALLDIGLPKLNGHDAARRIRQLPRGSDITLVALTGWGQDEDRRRSQEAGFDQHLVKPIDLATLRKLLAGLVDQAV
jgi:PAS domain S-box-containing protein